MKISDFNRYAVVCVVSALLAGCGGSQPPIGVPRSAQAVPQLQSGNAPHQVCPEGRPDDASCLALIVGTGTHASVQGLVPADFQARYKLPSKTKGKGQIVAVVDAHDNPNVASDLAVYRSNFGLGTAKFKKYNQYGQQGNYPSGDTGWGTSIDKDVELVSATCPKCTIYLIEANHAHGIDLEAAVGEAVKLGAHIISIGWSCYRCVDRGYFAAAGVEYVATAGPGGTPAVFDSVVAVGGTQLSKSGSQYSETIWDPDGGGCARGIKKPKWQSIVPNSVCAYRIANDTAAEAGCVQGVAMYDTYGYYGWIAICGYSVPAPLVAGIFGLAGNAIQQRGGRTFWHAKHHRDLYTLTGRCNGYSMGQYTTCAGWGSPDGIGAF